MDITQIDNPQRAVEVKVLAAAKQSRDALVDAVSWLDTYQWTDESLTWIWEKFKSFHEKAETPSVSTLVGMIRMQPVKQQAPLADVLRVVYNIEPSESLKTDCEFLLRCFHHDVVITGIEHANKHLEKGNLEGAVQVMNRATAESVSNSPRIRSKSLIDWDDWQKGPEMVRGIPTGFELLDEELQGGGSKGEMCLIMGNTNMGKSILAVNFGHAAVKHGHRVLHIDSENGEDATRWRYVARFSGKPTKSLQRRRLQPGMESWAMRRKTDLDKHLRILHVGVSSTTLPEIQKEVERLKREGFVPDEIVFDSPDQLAVPSNMDNIALYNKMLYEQLKGWIDPKNANVFLVAVIQAGKESEGKIATSKNAAWGYDKARIADTIISINPPLNDRGQPVAEVKMGNKRSLFVAKARSSASRFMVRVATNFTVAKITQETSPEADESQAEAS